MDPNANLEEQLRIAKWFRKQEDDGNDVPRHIVEAQMSRLSELVVALDEWVSSGGFLPDKWTKK